MCLSITSGIKIDKNSTRNLENFQSVNAIKLFFIPDVAPVFSKPPADTVVTEGMSAVLRCDVLGAPKPAIAWKKGKNLLFC